MREGKLFRNLGLWTLGAVYFLILVGGIVRATGSGMGCPDWPKCFGLWIPPTDISQLPVNYAEIFGAKLKGEVEFNIIKTWTEYINRLVGVIIGFFVFATFVVSFFTFRGKDNSTIWLCFVAFILVGFEGWLGSLVVSTELHPLMVTLHMLFSIIIVFILIFVITKSYSRAISPETINNSGALSLILMVALSLTIGQVLLGTQVRESIDEVAFRLGESLRSEWVSNLGGKFQIHRLFSIMLFFVHVLLFLKIKESSSQKETIRLFSNALFCMVLIEIFTGLILNYFDFSAYAQPIHLTFAILILGVQFSMILLLNKERLFREIPN